MRETFTTSEAAEQAGVTVRQWHYWADKLGVQPVDQLTGQRGVKFWNWAAIATVRAGVEVAA